MYHIVCPARYRRKVFSNEVVNTLRDVCVAIQARYEIHFIEIGADTDHIHFLVQSVPMLPPQRIVHIIKSITAREVFSTHPEVKKYLWGGKFWTSGYYINTVGQYANEAVIREYIKRQGNEYDEWYHTSPTLFEGLA